LITHSGRSVWTSAALVETLIIINSRRKCHVLGRIESSGAEGRKIYESRLREQLEQEYPDRYFCIEPSSGNHSIGETFDEAVNAAIDAFPDRLTHTLRIGHSAPLHLVVLV
jgi:hypothetical protein